MILANLVDAITDPATLLMTLLMLFGVLLIIIILLQKGRGGGLAGAFGGSGGQSALGTKAGDVFTKITIVMAVIWVILAGISGITTRASSGKYGGGSEAVAEEPSVTNPEEKPDTDPPVKEDSTPFNKIEENKEAPAAPAKKADEKPEAANKKTEPAKPDDADKPAEKKPEAPAKSDTNKSESKPK
ncbi:MAG: preprotein translocase subunit SecG [Gimesia sp.]|nr:preprotein translocase subunit SecG [Gimesia sp.]